MIAPLIIFLFPLAYSPGPGNLFFASVSARFGLRAAWPSLTGYHVATWIVTAIIGLSFSQVLQMAPQIFKLIGYAGSLYILYLAWKFWQAGSLEHANQAQPASFWDGAILMILNPKAYLIIALMFSQFLTSQSLSQVLLITTIFTLNNLIAFIIWSALGNILHQLFAKPEQARLMNRTLAIILAGVAIWMLL